MNVSLTPFTAKFLSGLVLAVAVISSSFSLAADVVVVTGSDALTASSATSPTGNQTAVTSGRVNDRRRHVIRGEREAAVITRLPQMKTEECRAERLEQTVKERGCTPRVIVNRYCYGQCNSFFIPRAATQSASKTRRHGRKQKHSATDGSEAILIDELIKPVQASAGRRRAVRTGSSLAGPETGTSPSSSMDVVELQWMAFRSCSFCRPKRVAWITVGFNCPRRRPAYRRRRIQIIKECACTALTLD